MNESGFLWSGGNEEESVVFTSFDRTNETLNGKEERWQRRRWEVNQWSIAPHDYSLEERKWRFNFKARVIFFQFVISVDHPSLSEWLKVHNDLFVNTKQTIHYYPFWIMDDVTRWSSPTSFLFSLFFLLWNEHSLSSQLNRQTSLLCVCFSLTDDRWDMN